MTNKTFITVMVMFLWFNPAVGADLSFITHNIDGKTYRDQNGELRGKKHSGRRGFQVELVREMMIRLKFTPRSHIIVPFKRGLRMIKDNQKPYAMFSTGKRPNRLGKMKFVGPLTQDSYTFYELKSAPTGIESIEQAKNLPICVQLGGNQDTFVTKNGFSNVIRTDYENCFKMLIKKRIGLASISHLDLNGVLKGANISPDLLNKTSVELYRSEGSLSFSNQVSDAVVSKWQSVLDEIKRSGKYDELLKDYLF